MILDPGFYVAAVPAVILLGLSKGGFYGVGMLALPLVSLVAPPLLASAILLPILLVQDAVTVASYRAEWSGRILAVMGPGMLVGIWLGYLLAAHVPAAAISLLLGLICIGFACQRLWLDRRGPLHPRPGRVWAGLLAGAASGFASMIAQAGGPPFQLWVMPQRLPRNVFVGTSAIFFAAMNWSKVPPFLALGQLSAGSLATSCLLMPLAVLSSLAGIALVRRVPAEPLYRLLYGLLILVGLKLCADGIAGLSGP